MGVKFNKMNEKGSIDNFQIKNIQQILVSD
jgi:hypothetical protein